MITPQAMISMLKRNIGVIERQIDGLSHEDSLLQPPFRGNCMNWIIGHMVVYRDNILKTANEAPLWNDADSARYGHDSEPITDGSSAIRFERIMADLRESQSRIEAALEHLTDDQLDSTIEGRARTIRDWLMFLVWHDTYHTGQTEYLRQLTGVNDKVI